MVRDKVGRKGFGLNWHQIGEEYLGGKLLKDLASQHDISQWTLLDNFKKLGIRKTTKRHQVVSVFQSYTPESCYWAGFLAADCCVREYSMDVELSSVDEAHLVLLRNFLQSNASIRRRIRKSKYSNKEYEYSTLSIYSKGLCEILKTNFNVIPNKSLTYSPPNLPDSCISHFIRGCIDGDGCIGWHQGNNKPRVYIGCGSRELINWIKETFENNIPNLGCPTLSENIHNRKNTLYSIEYLGYQARDILNWLYDGSSGNTRLDRKYEDYLSYIQLLSDYENKLDKKHKEKEFFLKQLISLYQGGMSSREISNHLNIGQQKVLYHLRKVGIAMKKSNNQNTLGIIRNRRDLEMLESYNAGKKPKEIAQENDLALSSFWVAIRRAKQIEA